MRHFKHVGLSTAIGLAALLACSQPASAFSSTGAVSMQATQLIARQTQTSFIDVDGSSGPSQGDEIVVSGDLLRNSVPVGNYGEVCTMTRTAPDDEFDLQCTGSLLLAEGDITFQGRFTSTAAAPATSSSRSPEAPGSTAKPPATSKPSTSVPQIRSSTSTSATDTVGDASPSGSATSPAVPLPRPSAHDSAENSTRSRPFSRLASNPRSLVHGRP